MRRRQATEKAMVAVAPRRRRTSSAPGAAASGLLGPLRFQERPLASPGLGLAEPGPESAPEDLGDLRSRPDIALEDWLASRQPLPAAARLPLAICRG